MKATPRWSIIGRLMASTTSSGTGVGPGRRQVGHGLSSCEIAGSGSMAIIEARRDWDNL